MGAIIFFYWLISALVSGLIGWLIGKSKGRGTAGFWFSFFFGVIGWIIVALLAPDYAKMGKIQCPFCKEWINPDALICPHCHQELVKRDAGSK